MSWFRLDLKVLNEIYHVYHYRATNHEGRDKSGRSFGELERAAGSGVPELRSMLRALVLCQLRQASMAIKPSGSEGPEPRSVRLSRPLIDR